MKTGWRQNRKGMALKAFKETLKREIPTVASLLLFLFLTTVIIYVSIELLDIKITYIDRKVLKDFGNGTRIIVEHSVTVQNSLVTIILEILVWPIVGVLCWSIWLDIRYLYYVYQNWRRKLGR